MAKNSKKGHHAMRRRNAFAAEAGDVDLDPIVVKTIKVITRCSSRRNECRQTAALAEIGAAHPRTIKGLTAALAKADA